MRTSVCLSSRSLLLPAGAGGRHGEHRHLPDVVLALGQDLARQHQPPPPQQQQQQVTLRVTSQLSDPKGLETREEARGQFFPDLKIPAVNRVLSGPAHRNS